MSPASVTTWCSQRISGTEALDLTGGAEDDLHYVRLVGYGPHVGIRWALSFRTLPEGGPPQTLLMDHLCISEVEGNHRSLTLVLDPELPGDANISSIADRFSPQICRHWSTMDAAERLLKLLGLLEGRIDWTAEELGQRLEVTTRTIRRDMSRLRTLGYPVEAVAGPGGGYRLGAGGKLPPLLLDDDEALAVALGLRLSTLSAVGGLEEASLSALAKLEHVLPPRLRSRLEDVSDATTSTLGPTRSPVDAAVFSELATATRRRERARLLYTDAEKRRSERHVEPVRLVYAGRRWYLVAFDLDRDDWRTFRLDRVTAPRSTGVRARPPRGPDPVQLVQRGITIDSWAFRASVILEVSSATAEGFVAPTVGTIETIDETRCRLVIGADEVAWLAHYLLGLPFGFEVETPEELRLELAAIGVRLVRRFGDGADEVPPE